MIRRRAESVVVERLRHMPAVALLGPRQAGKTTVARQIAVERPSAYLDLERPDDRSRLAEPVLYLADHADELVILDEVQRAPGLFETLRGVIDEGRWRGRPNGRFLLLGSASIDLLQQSGETLAGRIAYVELTPFDVLETAAADIALDELWVRGGFPDSLLAPDAAVSMAWRRDFVRTYLERDVPQLGPRIPAETLRRLWTMLAHHQGGLLNLAALARGLGVDGKTVAGYVDLLVDLLLVRRLRPWAANAGKRLVRSPKVYVRDSGLVHALLGLPSKEALLGHPVVGGSWEGLVVENVLAAAGDAVEGSFYRAHGGAEIDLVLSWPDGRRWAVEIKRTLAPRLGRGFTAAWRDLAPERGFVVYAGEERYPLREAVEAIDLASLCREVAATR